MKFTLPTITSKDVSPNTVKIYKSRLNKLAARGFTSIHAIMLDPHAVIAIINELFPGNDSSPEHQPSSFCRCDQCRTRENKRQYYTAIFYALADSPYSKSPNPLYNEFQRQKQNYGSH